MIDLDDLLAPIPGPDPCGQDLRPAPIYLQIREARREEDEAEQGVWKREVKKADFPQVVRLSTEALKTKGKELQIAAWLTEALVHRDGAAGLRQGLLLLTGLLERFWETVYPQPDEDGDLEFRATPLQWVGSQMDRVVRRVPLTAAGYNWLDYHESKSVPNEAAAERDPAKRALRQEALSRQRPTPETIEEACAATPSSFYERTLAELQEAQQALEALGELCDQRFGDVAPSFGSLRDTLSELAQCVRVFRGKAPVAAMPAAAAVAPAPPPADSDFAFTDDTGFDDWNDPPPEPVAAMAAPIERAPVRVPGDDAFGALAAIAADLREQDMFSPAPYLMVRGARWGELYAGGEELDGSLLAAPPAEIRVELRRLSQEGEWEQMLNVTERAAALPCCRGWLDLHRYTVRAAERSGFSAIARAVQSQVEALVQTYPSLLNETLTDDTPAANAETREWLRRREPSVAEPVWHEDTEVPDTYELALQAARGGDVAQAFELLTKVPETSGRGRFLARLKLAQLCLATSHREIAQPILQELEDEIERRHLSDWEAGGLLAQPLSLLYRCANGHDEEQRQRLYSQICRLDPVRALALETP